MVTFVLFFDGGCCVSLGALSVTLAHGDAIQCLNQ